MNVFTEGGAYEARISIWVALLVIGLLLVGVHPMPHVHMLKRRIMDEKETVVVQFFRGAQLMVQG